MGKNDNTQWGRRTGCFGTTTHTNTKMDMNVKMNMNTDMNTMRVHLLPYWNCKNKLKEQP